MDSEDGKRWDLFTFMRIPMYYANMYPLNLERRFPRPLKIVGFLLELIYEIFLYFVTIHIVIFHIYTICLNYNKGDLDLLVNCFMQVIIYSWVILMKLYFRHLRYKVFKDLIDFMNSKYKTRSAIGFTYVTMDDTLALANMFIKIYVYISIIGGLFWIIVPIAHGDRSLPLACWYPFDYKQPVIYEILYFLQSVGQFQVASAFCGSSGFQMILSILISGQYDILFCSLKNILATVAIERKASKSELRDLYKLQLFTKPEVNEFFCSKEITCKIDALIHSTTSNQCRNFRLNFRNPFKRSLNHQSLTTKQNQDFHLHFRKAFKKCVDHHRYILECLNRMESFFSPIWFLKTGEIISVMCLLAFISAKSTVINSSFIKTFLLAEYLLLVSWELLVICYFGEIVNANSQRCGEALMRSPWYIHMSEMKYDFLLFLLNSKRPFKLTAGKMYVINTELLRGMIKIAFSFLTLLQKIDERND